MKNLEVALCDSCEEYILRLASFLMDKIDAGIHIFTTTESFYSDEESYDIAIMAEEFKELSEFRPKGQVNHKYFLSETRENPEPNFIYKYQSATDILDEIKEFRTNLGASIKSNKKSKMVGIYSPVAHELQVPFAMALSQVYKTNGSVLFIDLEEISILPKFIGKSCERNILDLLFEIDTNLKEKLDLNQYIKSFMGIDYVEPFQNPNEIAEIQEETWIKLFKMLSNVDYSTVVILFGRTINGFNKYLENLDKLYVLGKPGDYFKKGQEIFLDYLERVGTGIESENVILPMSAGNLSGGKYQFEELLQGNLGTFARKLVSEKGQVAQRIYG